MTPDNSPDRVSRKDSLKKKAPWIAGAVLAVYAGWRVEGPYFSIGLVREGGMGPSSNRIAICWRHPERPSISDPDYRCDWDVWGYTTRQIQRDLKVIGMILKSGS